MLVNYYIRYDLNIKLKKLLIFLGDTAEMDKLNRRLVKVNKTHTDECKRLLTLMGIPYVEVHSAVGYINSFHDIDIGNVFIHRPHVRLKLNVQH